jgi:hypothetical protein
VRHLESCEYISPIGQKTGQLISLSGKYQSTLQKTTRNNLRTNLYLKIHAQFDSDLLDGIRIKAYVTNDIRTVPSVIPSISLYRVSMNWSETLVATVIPSESNGIYTAYVDQLLLGSNELSGAETYAIYCIATIRQKKYRKKIYVNHLGIYDNVFRLRQDVDFIDITKVDE